VNYVGLDFARERPTVVLVCSSTLTNADVARALALLERTEREPMVFWEELAPVTEDMWDKLAVSPWARDYAEEARALRDAMLCEPLRDLPPEPQPKDWYRRFEKRARV
jgi:hypothetical protein